jgi:hypothetical protein
LNLNLNNKVIIVENRLKYKILENSTSLGGIFLEYKEITGFELNNSELKLGFLELLKELIQDGAICLADYRNNTKKILTGSPSEQVNEIAKVWPTMSEMSEYFPDDPWFYLVFWWGATCPIELAELPILEVYE